MKKIFLAISFLPCICFAESVKLQTVSVHLFLEKSGILSEDVTTTEEFFTHNFRPFGEGIPENEIFHDYLIRISFASDKEEFIEGEVAKITIKDSSNKEIFSESISNLYVGSEKLIYQGIWVKGHECEPQTIVVAMNETKIRKKLPFHCGE